MQTLDRVIDAAIARNRIVGAVVILARNGEIVYHRASGLSDREAGIAAETVTLFRLASLTKLALSAAAFALVEQGTIALDEPVTTWIPSFRPALEDGRTPAITIAQLLNHTSGLTYGWNEAEDGPYHRANVSDGLDQPGLTIEENLRRIATVPLLFEPGTAFAYSIGTDVAAEALARAAKCDLTQLLRRTVFEPLGIANMTFHTADRSRLAAAYADGDPPVRMNDALHLVPMNMSALRFSPARAFDATSYPSGGTGLIGTAEEFLRLLEALRGGGAPIVSETSARTITSNAIGDLPSGDPREGWRYGYGVSVLHGDAAAQASVSPGSWLSGGVYGNNYWFDPKRGVSAVVLTNTAIAGMIGDFPDAVRSAVAESTG